MTTDSLWGVINDNGKCVVKPEYYSLNDYGDGKFIGVNVKYKKDIIKGKKDKVKISVLDTSVSYGYLNGLFPDTSADADTVVVDTTAVDSVAVY